VNSLELYHTSQAERRNSQICRLVRGFTTFKLRHVNGWQNIWSVEHGLAVTPYF